MLEVADRRPPRPSHFGKGEGRGEGWALPTSVTQKSRGNIFENLDLCRESFRPSLTPGPSPFQRWKGEEKMRFVFCDKGRQFDVSLWSHHCGRHLCPRPVGQGVHPLWTGIHQGPARRDRPAHRNHAVLQCRDGLESRYLLW